MTEGQSLRAIAAGYRVIKRIRRGPDTAVYHAVRESDGVEVALKVLLSETYPIDGEAAKLRLLPRHPALVRVLSTGRTVHGFPYLAMEYHPAGSYADVLARSGPVPVEEVVRVGIAVAGALQAAHGVGVLHRDVTPANILRGTDGPLLTDFGSAAMPEELAGTVALDRLTPHHAAPEVLRRQPQDARSDVYGLASTLWTLLAGHPPFAAADDPSPDPFEYREYALHRPVPPVPRDDVPEWLQDVLRRAMAKDPADRHASAEEFAADLRDRRSSRTEPARPPAPVIQVPPSGTAPSGGTTPVDPESSVPPVVVTPAAAVPTSPRSAGPATPPASGSPAAPSVRASTGSPVRPSPADPAVGSSGRTEPGPAAPARSEPPRSEPVRSEPVRSEPVGSEPTRSEPVRSEAGPAGSDQPAREPARRSVAASGVLPAEVERSRPDESAGTPPAPRRSGTVPPSVPEPNTPPRPASSAGSRTRVDALSRPEPAAPSRPVPASPAPASPAPPRAVPSAPAPAGYRTAPASPVPGRPDQPRDARAGHPAVGGWTEVPQGRPVGRSVDDPLVAQIPPAPTVGGPGPGPDDDDADPAEIVFGAGLPEADGEPRRRLSRSVPSRVAVAIATLVIGLSAVLVGSLVYRSVFPDQPEPATVVAAAPEDLRLTDERVVVTLTWRDTSDGQAAFYVVGAPQGSAATTLASAARGSTSVRVNGLNPGVDYCFRLVAVWSVDEVATSEEACTARFGTPTPR